MVYGSDGSRGTGVTGKTSVGSIVLRECGERESYRQNDYSARPHATILRPSYLACIG
jgi:hypothetical protein